MVPSKPAQGLREPGFTKKEGVRHFTSASLLAPKEPGERSGTRRKVAETHKSPHMTLTQVREHDQVFIDDDAEEVVITNRANFSSEITPTNDQQQTSEHRRFPKPKIVSKDSKPDPSALPLPAHPTRSLSLRQPRAPKTSSAAGNGLARTVSSVTPRSGTNSTRSVLVTGQQTREPKPAWAEDHGRGAPRSSGDASMHSQIRVSRETAVKGHVKNPAAVKDGHSSATRPQFSAFQREFTPKKSTTSATFVREAPIASQSTAAPLSTGVLQDELLQLQWMYHTSHRVFRDWAESGAENIKCRQWKLGQKANKIQSAVQNQQDWLNVGTLRHFIVDDRGQINLSKVEVLDQCIRSLADISRAHGQYSEIVKRFEQWYEETRENLDGRSGQPRPEDVRAVNQLDRSWKDAFPTLMHTLESCLDALDRVEPSKMDASSGLHQTVTTHQALAHGMVSELKLMDDIYSSALQHDEQWLSNKVTAILDAGQESSSRSWQRRAAWE